jgi:phosphoenolpyruvate synthase/pyruvate phosphate dikinase
VAAGVFSPDAKDPERNPAMGRRGVRGLLANQDVLRLQLRAILRAAVGSEHVGVLIPFVTSVMDVQRVKAILIEERLALRKAKVPVAGSLALAPILEVPVAAFGIGALAVESDFLVLAIDDLQAYLLAADRDNTSLRTPRCSSSSRASRRKRIASRRKWCCSARARRIRSACRSTSALASAASRSRRCACASSSRC